MLEWPADRNVPGIETQYMFGESLMAAPVLIAAKKMKKTVSVYFLQGVWFDFWTKQKFVESRAMGRRASAGIGWGAHLG